MQALELYGIYSKLLTRGQHLTLQSKGQGLTQLVYVIVGVLVGTCGVGERVGMTSSVPEFGMAENDVSAAAGGGAAAAAATPLAAAAVSLISDLDDSLQHSCTLPIVDDEMQSVDTTGKFC